MRVGILQSLTGTMAISEVPLRDAALMAIAEINAAGGVLGQPLEPIVADGASDQPTFATQAQRLIQTDGVVTLFGCWTSASRKAVLPVVEALNCLLWYPVQYEGLESSPNIFYTGSCLNQQVEPAVHWLLQQQWRRVYLLGSDYLFPHTANRMISALLKAAGGEVVGEDYVGLGRDTFEAAIAHICQTQPDVVFSTLNGDSNVAFYQQYQQAGITATQIPIMAVSVAEAELQQIGAAAVGHYAAWSYFQSLSTPANQQFVQRFQHRYGADRVTSDPIEAAYLQVYLWKQAVEAAESTQSDRVRVAAYGQTFQAPGGLVRVEPNQHLWKPCRIGQVLPNGQFEQVWWSDRPLKPLPWLGVEDSPLHLAPAVRDVLADVPQWIQKAQQLEQRTIALETTLAAVIAEQEERQKTAQALHDTCAELQAIIASVDELIVVHDRQGRCLRIPSASSTSLSHERDQKIGRTFHDLFPVDIADRFLDYTQQSLDRQETLTVEYNLTMDEAECWFEASISPLDENTVVWVIRDISDRRQTELALTDSEDRFRAVFEHSAIGMGVNRADGSLIESNPAVEAILGYTTEELRALHFTQYTHPDDLDADLALLEELLAGQRDSYQLEKRYIRKDGQPVWVRLTLSAVRDSSGELSLTIAMMEDITEAKRIAEELRRSEFQYRDLVQSANSFILRWSRAGQITFLNAYGLRTLGFTEAELIGRNIMGTLVPETESSGRDLRQLIDEINHNPDAYRDVENENICKNGDRLWIKWANKGVVDEQGELTEILAVGFDISDRKRAEQQLRDTEERYRSIVENAVSGIFQTTLDGHYLSANPALAKIYGYETPDDLIQNLGSIQQQLYVNPTRRVEFAQLMQTQGRIANFESQIYRRDGTIIWISEQSRAVLDGNGTLLYYEGIVEDITQRKQAEIALQESMSLLATANQQITRLNAQLQSENLRMGAELAITRQLQQMMLPRPEELEQIPDLDIAGFMEPADEVGGDYYDVIQHDGRVIFGIGDVTGHGLESGMMMLMVQTAVRTMLATNETRVQPFFYALNRAIYDNMQRMNSGKSTTLALLDYQNGNLHLSGQHEEILVVRANSTVERIDTNDLGLPLGLVGDIRSFIAQVEIRLQPDDGIVLYTDGITEAESGDRHYYGIERLCAVVAQHWHQGAIAVQQAVIADVRHHIGTHKVYDDMTLLVVKRK
jgi:urea ABC transporter urea binding protein